jgi:hypothetical protein
LVGLLSAADFFGAKLAQLPTMMPQPQFTSAIFSVIDLYQYDLQAADEA